jgi:hypothetical protein
LTSTTSLVTSTSSSASTVLTTSGSKTELEKTSLDDPEHLQSGAIKYRLAAENTGKRWCRGPGGPSGSSAAAGEGDYTSGDYSLTQGVPTLGECAALCTERDWCLGLAYKLPESWKDDVDFQEGSCQLVSKLELIDSDITDLVSYAKGVFKTSTADKCYDLLSREQCADKASTFGQTVENSPAQVVGASEAAPAGCYRNSNNGKFYWSTDGTGYCSITAQCLCD